MSCFITAGISAFDCSTGIGGISDIYILGGSSGATVSGITYSADGSITGATGSGTWFHYNVRRGTSSLTQTIQKNFENASVFFEQSLLAVFYRYDQEKRNQVLAMARQDNLKIIAVDANGTQYYLGQKYGMMLQQGSATSGLAPSDRNGFELTFQSNEPEPARVIEGDLATVFSGFTFE